MQLEAKQARIEKKVSIIFNRYVLKHCSVDTDVCITKEGQKFDLSG